MNIINIITKSLTTLTLGFSLLTPISADIKYRLANLNDVDQILILQEQFNEDDKSKLLVFPQTMQRNIITKNIQKKHFFIAVDSETEKIISFLKLYIIEPDEVIETLDGELCLGLHHELIKDCYYNFTVENLNNFRLPLTKIDPTQIITSDLISPREINLIRENKLNSTLYMYHGSAYTHPVYRGKGISTTLLQYAFDTIQENFPNQNFLVLLYGQVKANANNVAMIRTFAGSISDVFSQESGNNFKLQHLCSKAYKPEFNQNNELQIICDERHAGLGNMILYKVKN